MTTVVCLGTKETLAGPYGLGHSIIHAILSPLKLSDPLQELEPKSSGLLYTHEETHLTVVPGVPSLFLGVRNEVHQRAMALAKHLHEKIVLEGTSTPFFMYGYSRGCLVLLKALQILDTQLSAAQCTSLQVHLFLNDPVPGGITLSTQEKRLPAFIKEVEVVYLKHEERFLHESLTGIHGTSLTTQATLSFLNGNHTSATRVPYSEIDFQSHAIDQITQKVGEKLHALKRPSTLQVFATHNKEQSSSARPIGEFSGSQDDAAYVKSASTLRQDSSFFVKYLPKSRRFVPEGNLQPYQHAISYGFDRDLACIEKKVRDALNTTSFQPAITSKNLKKLMHICQKMGELRQHIETAQHQDNRFLIAQNFNTGIEALHQLTTKTISQSIPDADALQPLITTLKTIANEAKHHSPIRRQALLLCKIVASIVFPPLALVFAYQGLFNCKTKTTLLAENMAKELNHLETSIKTNP